MNDGSGLQYLLTDQLGSVVAVTSSSGTLISQQRYMPFGQVRTDVSSGAATDLGFTGQRNLDAQGNESLGLMDYHARMYDAALGRFISPDSIIPAGGPQSLNRYAYVLNDPIALNDPTGHRFSDHMDPTEKKIILNTYRKNSSGGSHRNGKSDKGKDNKVRDFGIELLSELGDGLSESANIRINVQLPLELGAGNSTLYYSLNPDVAAGASKLLALAGLLLAVGPDLVTDFSNNTDRSKVAADVIVDTAVWGGATAAGAGTFAAATIFSGGSLVVLGAVAGAGAAVVVGGNLARSADVTHAKSNLANRLSFLDAPLSMPAPSVNAIPAPVPTPPLQVIGTPGP